MGESHPDGGCFQFGCEPALRPLVFQVSGRRFGSSAGHDGGASPGAHGAPGAAGRLRLAAVPHQAGLCRRQLGGAFHQEKAPKGWAELTGGMSVWPGEDLEACWEA